VKFWSFNTVRIVVLTARKMGRKSMPETPHDDPKAYADWPREMMEALTAVQSQLAATELAAKAVVAERDALQQRVSAMTTQLESGATLQIEGAQIAPVSMLDDVKQHRDLCRKLQNKCDNILLQARTWKQEARTYRAIVWEICSLLGGMGDWQGVSGAVRKVVEDRGRLRQTSTHYPGKHAADCCFWASVVNGRPTDGICTCGYGMKCRDTGDYSQQVSEERWEAELPPNALEQKLRVANLLGECDRLRYALTWIANQNDKVGNWAVGYARRILAAKQAEENE
jgi:hypothetical protein